MKKRLTLRQAKQVLDESDAIRRWAIQRQLTPEERYKLGPTNTWHTPRSYFLNILPLWCPKSEAWPEGLPTPMPATTFYTLVKGGIVETTFTIMRDVYTGKKQDVYICDSIKTRQILEAIQAEPLRSLAWRRVKTYLVTQTFEEGWLLLFQQALALRRKLEKPDWKKHLMGRCINLADWIKPGEYVNSGLMPPELLIYALRLIHVYMFDYIRNDHISGGTIITETGKERRILIIWGYHQLIKHQQVRALDFYRSNLQRAPSKFKRVLHGPPKS